MLFLTVTPAILEQFRRAQVFFRLNGGQVTPAGYGWMTVGSKLALRDESLRIECNVGLYGGAYKGLVGGPSSSGLCTAGSFSYSYSPLPEGLKMGRYCSISTGLTFLDSGHPTHTLTTSAALFRPRNKLFEPCQTARVKSFTKTFSAWGERPYPVIGNDVWIGHGVTLAMGIHIGDGAVIAANSTVVKDVPPYAMMGGNPAQLLKMRFPNDLVAELLATRWWDAEPGWLFSLDVKDPAAVSRHLRQHQAPAYEPEVLYPARLAEPADVVAEPDDA